MPLRLSSMLEDDIDDFGILDELSMEGWTFARLMDTSGRPRREFAAEWARKEWGKDDKAHWLKVIDDETGEMVSMAMWRFPLQNQELPAVPTAVPEEKPLSEAEERQRKFWAEAESIKREFFAEIVGTKPHAYLQLLLTHPSHRRRGAGSMLIKWGCEQADRLGIMCVLTSSTMGEIVYRKNGFEVKKAVEMDLSPFGVDEVELRRFMIREPRGGSAQ